MKQQGVLTGQSLFFVALAVLIPSLAAAGAMKMTAARLPLPTDNEAHSLPGLRYAGRGGVSEITSIRLDLASEKGADPVRAVWTLSGRSTVPKLQKVMLMVYLLDVRGKRIAAMRKTAVFKSADTHREFILNMKVKSKIWTRAKTVFVQVNFMVVK